MELGRRTNSVEPSNTNPKLLMELGRRTDRVSYPLALTLNYLWGWVVGLIECRTL